MHPSPGYTDLFLLTNQMKCKNQDVKGEKPVCNDIGELCLDDRAKQVAWKEHYERLSNVEFIWDLQSLTEVYPVKGPVPHIRLEVVIKAIKPMKCGKAASTSQIIAEMLKASGVERVQQMRDLINDIHFRKIPTEWKRVSSYPSAMASSSTEEIIEASNC